MAKKVLFIDRDGTLIKEPADEQIDAFDKLEFYPKCFFYLGKIAKEGEVLKDVEIVHFVAGLFRRVGGEYESLLKTLGTTVFTI